MGWCRTRREEVGDFSVRIYHELLVSEDEFQRNIKWWIKWEEHTRQIEWYGMYDGTVVEIVRQGIFNSYCMELDVAEVVKDLYWLFTELRIVKQRGELPMLPRIRYGGEVPRQLEEQLKKLGVVREVSGEGG
jgi:hypothetical protein